MQINNPYKIESESEEKVYNIYSVDNSRVYKQLIDTPKTEDNEKLNVLNKSLESMSNKYRVDRSASNDKYKNRRDMS